MAHWSQHPNSKTYKAAMRRVKRRKQSEARRRNARAYRAHRIARLWAKANPLTSKSRPVVIGGIVLGALAIGGLIYYVHSKNALPPNTSNVDGIPIDKNMPLFNQNEFFAALNGTSSPTALDQLSLAERTAGYPIAGQLAADQAARLRAAGVK
jgi:hypothetical protein